jgi:hypothetical protein
MLLLWEEIETRLDIDMGILRCFDGLSTRDLNFICNNPLSTENHHEVLMKIFQETS